MVKEVGLPDKTFIVKFESWVIQAKDSQEAEEIVNADLENNFCPFIEEIVENEDIDGQKELEDVEIVSVSGFKDYSDIIKEI